MIKFKDGQLTDILPVAMKQGIETQCISYAMQQQTKRIMQLADRTRTVAVIDELPEKILDVLAVELRTPYYQEGMDIDTKRSIIKKTLLWHTKAGTPSAVTELITIVFGEGGIVEWFDYDEPPYTPGTFDIVTSARLTEEISEYFLSIIQRVKNTRSHIRRVLIERSMEMKETVASGIIAEPEVTVLNHSEHTESQTMSERIAGAVAATPIETVTNSPQGRNETAEHTASVAAGMMCEPHEIIGNHADPKAATASHTIHAFAGAMASTRTIIYNGALEETRAIAGGPSTAAGLASHSKITI